MTRVIFKVFEGRAGDSIARQALDIVRDHLETDFGDSVSIGQRPAKMIATFGEDVDRTEVEDYLRELWEFFADRNGGFICGSEQSLYDDAFDGDDDLFNHFIDEVPGIVYPFYDMMIGLRRGAEDKEVIFWIED